jgi:hypothetical protein
VAEPYEVRPLKWIETGEDTFEAETPFGKYVVSCPYGDGWEWGLAVGSGGESYPCVSEFAGKAKADAHWRVGVERSLVSKPKKRFLGIF